MFWNLQVLKPMALYDGLPGVILFLAYLGEVTGNAMYSDIARSAWVTVQKAVETLLLPDPSALGLPRRLYPLGAFEGSGSYIYLCAHLSILWRDLAYARHAEELLDLVEQDVERDTRLDVANGVAGCIASLLCLYQVASSPRAQYCRALR